MNESPTILQWILGAITLATGLLVVLGRNPIVNAISLMATLFTTGLLYFSLGAHFVGVVQILIYAGAISVLIVFIVMLLDLRPAHVRVPGRSPTYVIGTICSIVFFVAAILSVLPILKNLGAIPSLGDVGESLGQAPEEISMQLLSKYMIPFQATALLLLAAVMGVVVLGKKNMLSERKGADKP
ncbi:MAG: NADH-quinone oxidoreductase subunit J [Bdellovibrionota bacterium]